MERGVLGFPRPLGITPLKNISSSNSSSTSNPVTEVMFKDKIWEDLERKKREEWTAKGYSPHLQDMAIELAHDYVTGISGWISTITKMPREEVERKLYDYALNVVAERWIETMSK